MSAHAHKAVGKRWWLFLGLGLLLLSTRLWHGASAQRVPLPTDERNATVGQLPGSFHTVIQPILSAVVAIETFNGPRETSQWARKEFAERTRRSPNSHNGPQNDDRSPGRDAVASGLVIDRSGIILTNNHVVEHAEAIIVHLADGRQFPATDVKTDAWSDLAILRIKGAGDLTAARWGNSDDLKVGDWVASVGNPFGLLASVSVGVISAKDRKLEHTSLLLLQTDAATNPGNSGGPLVNVRGEVVGINEGASSFDGGFQGIGFAIPANLVRPVVRDLMAQGTVQRSYFGAVSELISPDVAKKLGLSAHQQGALLTDVIPGTPAEQAGFQAGDVVLTFADQTIRDAKHLQKLIQRLPPGKIVHSGILRDGTPRVLTTQLRGMPSSAQGTGHRTTAKADQGYLDRQLGMSIANPTPEEIQPLGYDNHVKGVLVTAVEPGGIAYFNSIRAGMMILRVGNASVRSISDYQAAVKQQSINDGILMLFGTPDGNHFLVVKP